jgi:HSP20 family protein
LNNTRQASPAAPNFKRRKDYKTMKATLQREPRVNNDRPQEYICPGVNIFETNDGYVLEAEMPGVNKDGLEITLEGNELTIVGRRQTPALNGNSLFRESHQADYRRMFELDPAIDTTKVAAKMDQGVLTLTLPKSEKVKPRKIKVD